MRMRAGLNRLGLWLCWALLLPLAMGAQQTKPPASPAQPSVAATTAKPSSVDYSQEPFVIEQYYTTAHFENDGTGERDLAVRIRVQSDAGVQQLGELVFGYNSANEQMDVRYVRVRKEGGAVVTAGPEAVKEMTAMVARDAPVYTDYKEKHITVPALRPGETLEYEITTRMVKPLAPNQFWYEHNFLDSAIVLDERLEVNVPQGRAVNLRSPDFPYAKEEEEGRVIYRWKRANLARPTEDELAKTKSQRPESTSPAVQLTTFANWEEVARWYASLEQGRADPTPEIRAKTQGIIEGRASQLDKIQALYEYVSKNVRYVSLSFGLGRYQPHSAAQVFSNQYGDCKDKQTLLAAMLEAAGIPSDAVLIPYMRKLDLSVPSPSQIDHVITAVPEGKELVWMDSTAEVAPFRLLSSALRAKSALLVPPDGVGKIVETPADPPFPSFQQVKIEAQVSELGKLSGQVHYSLRGDTEFGLRVAFHRTPQNQWKQLGQTIATLDGVHGEITAVKPSDPSDMQKPFELELDFSQPNFLDWSGKKAKVGLPLLTIGMPDASEESAEAIRLGTPLQIAMSLKLVLPENFEAQPPVAISVTRDFAKFESSYRMENHTLYAERKLDFKMRELPAARTSEYLAFTHAVEADENQVLAIENSTIGPPTIPASAKPDELLEAGIAALNSGNPRASVPLFQRVVELEPKHKKAWNDLGLSYLRLGKLDDAAGAFRKQIEVNPYDEHAYDYLGLALNQQQKYAEAAEAFRKQIDVNPLDPIAHAALGGLFLVQHNYAEAVPELDKATILSPDSAELQVSLGQAYLNTGEKEKALAAFEKGAELSQAPVVWNNIAYNLAQHQIELDKAQRYAESAVSATAANLRNIELPHLSFDNLNEVASIASYWDTLGWVFFQKGDLETAEQFVRASWLLSQHGEVGDHLAQIYEKRDQKVQASHMYALALAAAHAVPETRGRLAALLGSDLEIDELVKQARPELTAARTIPAGKILNENVEADFFLLLSPDGTNTKVDAVRYVSGSERLRPFADRLRSLNYGAMFPNASPAKIVRRGTLSCAATSAPCKFFLILPEDVRTLN